MNPELGGADSGVCASHPLEDVVGICASCLRERLHSLKLKQQQQLQYDDGDHSSRKPCSSSSSATILNLIHASAAAAPSSSSDSHHQQQQHQQYFQKKNSSNSYCYRRKSSLHGSIKGAPADTLAVTIKREPRRSFLWITRRAAGIHRKNNNATVIRDRVKAFSFRSLFHKLARRKEQQPKRERPACISHEDSFISIKLDGGGGGGGGAGVGVGGGWGSSMISAQAMAMQEASSSSERSSSFDAAVAARTSWDGVLFDKDMAAPAAKEPPLQQLVVESALSPFSHKPCCDGNKVSTAAAAVRWRTRMNGLFQLRWKMPEQEQQNLHQHQHQYHNHQNPNNNNNKQPTSQKMKGRLRNSIHKMWSLSDVYNSYIADSSWRRTGTEGGNKDSNMTKAKPSSSSSSSSMAGGGGWNTSMVTPPKWNLNPQ